MKEENLIFIVSQPRSGSTYLQNLLSNNEETNTCSEPWILLNFVNQIKPDLLTATFNNDLSNIAFKDYLSKYGTDFNLKQKQFLLNLYSPLAEGFRYVIDKTPRYWEILDEISLLFPKSKIIVLKRNPIDVAKSMIKTWDIETLDKLAEFKRDLLLAPNKIQKFYLTNKKNPNIYILKYEDLILNTEVIVKSLYNWLGLKFELTVLDTSENNKFKGNYGDPFQNSENYILAKNCAASKELSVLFQDFIRGYYNYLGSDFLKEYGNYENQKIEPKRTIAFTYFLYFTNKTDKPSVHREIYWSLKKLLFDNILKRKSKK